MQEVKQTQRRHVIWVKVWTLSIYPVNPNPKALSPKPHAWTLWEMFSHLSKPAHSLSCRVSCHAS